MHWLTKYSNIAITKYCIAGIYMYYWWHLKLMDWWKLHSYLTKWFVTLLSILDIIINNELNSERYCQIIKLKASLIITTIQYSKALILPSKHTVVITKYMYSNIAIKQINMIIPAIIGPVVFITVCWAQFYHWDISYFSVTIDHDMFS